MGKSMGISVQHLKILHKVIAGKCIFVGRGWHWNCVGEPEPSIPTWFYSMAPSVSWSPILPGAEPGTGEDESQISQEHGNCKGLCALEGTQFNLLILKRKRQSQEERWTFPNLLN